MLTTITVMGSPTILQVHGGDPGLLDRAEQRLRELESWWSRFVADSDITRANQSAGTPVVVHEDTLAIVGRALDGWRQTRGHFDITTLPALLEAGYTNSTVDASLAPRVGGTRIGQSALIRIDHETSTLTVPPSGAIDLGGIGKGFAADIVAEEMIEAGATAALANVGGDIAVLGTPPDGPWAHEGAWLMGIADPRDPDRHLARFRMVSGGVATSGTSVRGNHLIDPVQAAPARTGVLAVTVIANDAATAEVFATAAAVLPPHHAVALLDGVHLAGLVVTDDGDARATSTLKDFLV